MSLKERKILETNAIFSPDRRYRYSLWRKWEEGNSVLFICLNPSTADEVTNDPTVTRCMNRAREWGFGTCYVGNIFALRSTDPKELYRVGDPVGAENDKHLRDMERQAYLVVVAWGNHGVYRSRGWQVLTLLEKTLYCLGTNNTGQPKHPLYLPANTELRRFIK